jgi:hypothetical protein
VTLSGAKAGDDFQVNTTTGIFGLPVAAKLHSLFCAMTTPFEGGTQAETRQGMSAADAAKAAGVHLLSTSAGSATGIPHFDKEHIAKTGVRATVLASVYFINNLYFDKEQLAKGIYATPLPPTS